MNKIKQKNSIHNMVGVILHHHEKALSLLPKQTPFVDCNKLSGNELSVLLAVWARMPLFDTTFRIRDEAEKCINNAIAYNNKMYPGTFKEGIQNAFLKLAEKNYIQQQNKKYRLSEEAIMSLKNIFYEIKKTAE